MVNSSSALHPQITSPCPFINVLLPPKKPWSTGIKGRIRNSVTVRSHASVPQDLKHCSIHQEVLLPMLIVELLTSVCDCLPLILIWCPYFNVVYSLVFKNVCKCWEKRLDLTFFKLATGCTGALAHELVQIYPNLKVTVFDLPEVIANTSYFQPSGQHTAPVTFVSGK